MTKMAMIRGGRQRIGGANSGEGEASPTQYAIVSLGEMGLGDGDDFVSWLFGGSVSEFLSS